jgi:hypothetical protein
MATTFDGIGMNLNMDAKINLAANKKASVPDAFFIMP